MAKEKPDGWAVFDAAGNYIADTLRRTKREAVAAYRGNDSNLIPLKECEVSRARLLEGVVIRCHDSRNKDRGRA